jgi:hypothetical protein
MSKKQESLKVEIYNLLKSRGLQPLSLDSSGKTVPIPDEAEVFQFEFIKDEENYGKVYVTLDGLRQLIIYYNDEVARSPKAGSNDSESWENLLRILKRFATQRQLSFELSDQDNLENDMAKREHLKKQEQVNESYYAQGRKASYSDNVPTVTMRIQHSKVMEEGEQRFRHIEKIFVENQLGERFLLPTNKPGLGRVYARHIAEGGKSGDDRWNHITSLCEEYNKMAGFVRATRNGQFNESAQRLVTEGINHYQKLRESLSRLTGKRGYNAYFESYTPALMEDEEQVDLSEMFMTASLDPRIESVMPILSKLNKNLGETKEIAEVIALEEWADSLVEFAPPSGDDNGGDDDELLKKIAKQWWLGTEQDMIKAERTLASMGWEIGEDEGSYDNGGVFVVRAGDVNGKSYQSWPHEELAELDEDWKSALAGGALAASMALGGGMAHAQSVDAQAPIAATQQAPIGSTFTAGVDVVGPRMIAYKGGEFKFAGRDAEAPATAKTSVVVPMSAVGVRSFKPVTVQLDTGTGMYYISAQQPANEGTDDYVDPEEADYGEEYQNMVKGAGDFVKGVDQRKLDTIKRMHDIISGKNKEQPVDEGTYSHDVERAFPNGKASGVKTHSNKPAVVKTNKPIGTRVSDIGKGGKEYNVKTDKEWDKQQGVEEGLGYSQDPEQAKWYHEGRRAYKGGTTGNLIQDIAKKHGCPTEWLKAFHAGYQDQEGWGKEDMTEGYQLDEGIMDSINGLVSKIKAVPGIQKFIQAAQAKKDELINAARHSRNGADLVKNIQAVVGGQQAVVEGWGDKIAGGLVAGAGGSLMAAGAELFMRAWNAMGQPDLTTMTANGNYDGRIVLALTTMLVLVGALALFGGGAKFKQGLEQDAQSMREGQADLDTIKRLVGL